jgi:hypothetical protein
MLRLVGTALAPQSGTHCSDAALAGAAAISPSQTVGREAIKARLRSQRKARRGCCSRDWLFIGGGNWFLDHSARAAGAVLGGVDYCILIILAFFLPRGRCAPGVRKVDLGSPSITQVCPTAEDGVKRKRPVGGRWAGRVPRPLGGAGVRENRSIFET